MLQLRSLLQLLQMVCVLMRVLGAQGVQRTATLSLAIHIAAQLRQLALAPSLGRTLSAGSASAAGGRNDGEGSEQAQTVEQDGGSASRAFFLLCVAQLPTDAQRAALWGAIAGLEGLVPSACFGN